MIRKRSFWRWICICSRAGLINEARKKRIMQGNLTTWNKMNRGFIEKCNREDATRIYGTSADEESAVGYGSDSGDAM